MSRQRASFFDNLQHVLRSAIAIRGYSDNTFVNALYTRLSVTIFVGKHWRRRAFVTMVCSGLFGVASGVYAALFAPDQEHTVVATLAAVLGIAGPAGVLVRRWLVFHRVRIFGAEGEESKLAADRLVDKTFIESDRLHFTKLVDRDETAQIIEVKYPDHPDDDSWIEFDASIATHLLDGRIDCLKGTGGGYFHFGTGDVLDDSSRHRPTQSEVLLIRADNAVRKRKSFFDSPKLSLGSIDLDDGLLKATIGTTSYYCSTVTNDAAAKVVTDRIGHTKNDDTLLMFPARRRTDPDPDQEVYVLDSISQTLGLSNHIGSVVAAVSSDNIPILCFQNRNASVAGGRSVLSGSGSLEKTDFVASDAIRTGFLDDAIRFGMARELLEETGGIPQDSYREFDRARLRDYAKRIQLAGFYRDLRRGGLPIFVGFCKMEADFEAIKTRRASKIWWTTAPVETTIDERLPKMAVHSSGEYQDYLRTYVAPTSTTKRNPSDQVLIIDRLLDFDAVAAHLQRALDS